MIVHGSGLKFHVQVPCESTAARAREWRRLLWGNCSTFYWKWFEWLILLTEHDETPEVVRTSSFLQLPTGGVQVCPTKFFRLQSGLNSKLCLLSGWVRLWRLLDYDRVQIGNIMSWRLVWLKQHCCITGLGWFQNFMPDSSSNLWCVVNHNCHLMATMHSYIDMYQQFRPKLS